MVKPPDHRGKGNAPRRGAGKSPRGDSAAPAGAVAFEDRRSGGVRSLRSLDHRLISVVPPALKTARCAEHGTRNAGKIYFQIAQRGARNGENTRRRNAECGMHNAEHARRARLGYGRESLPASARCDRRKMARSFCDLRLFEFARHCLQRVMQDVADISHREPGAFGDLLVREILVEPQIDQLAAA